MRAYYDTVYDITSDCQNRLIPDNAMNVLDFIQLELPKTTSAILTYSAKTLFSKESPTEDIQCPTSRNIPSVTVIAAASSVSVQLFQQVYRNHFRIFHESPGSSRIKRYALIQSSYFLCTLSNLLKLALGGTLQLSDLDYIFFGRINVSMAEYHLYHQGNERQGI